MSVWPSLLPAPCYREKETLSNVPFLATSSSQCGVVIPVAVVCQDLSIFAPVLSVSLLHHCLYVEKKNNA